MVYKKEERNFNKVQFANIRNELDNSFNVLHDNLSECYYDYWKEGLSKEFVFRGKAFDKQPNLQKSKQLFDKLHGILFHLREIEFHILNNTKSSEEKIPEEKYRYLYNEDGSIKRDMLQDSIDKLAIFDTEEKINIGK